MELRPDPGGLPPPQPAPAGHAGATAHLLRQHLPRDARAQNEEDAGQRGAIRHARTTAFRLRGLTRQQRLHHRPERVGHKGLAHAPLNAPDPVLLGALSRHSPDRQPIYLRFIGRIDLAAPLNSTKRPVSCLNGPRWPLMHATQRQRRSSSTRSDTLLPSCSSVAAVAFACRFNIARPALVAVRRSSPRCA